MFGALVFNFILALFTKFSYCFNHWPSLFSKLLIKNILYNTD